MKKSTKDKNEKRDNWTIGGAMVTGAGDRLIIAPVISFIEKGVS